MKRVGSDDFVPMSFSAELDFNNATAAFYCSFEDHAQQWAVIGGSEGFLRVDDFVLPYAGKRLSFETHRADFVVDECQFDMRENTTVHSIEEAGNNAINSPETKLISSFSDLVLGNERSDFWGNISLKTQLVLDACFKSAKNGSEPVIVPNP